MFGYFLVIPMDYRIPKIRIRINDVSKVKNRRLVVRIDSWPIDSQFDFSFSFMFIFIQINS